jgi:hypothetical protein
MGRGGAVCALDRGWGAAVAAVDGEPKPRRRSGEVWWSEQGKVSEMSVCKCKSECARSSRMCSGYRRRCVASKLARRREAWQLGRRRRDVGKAGAGQRGVGKAAARQRRMRGMAQSGAEAAGALHMASKSGGGASGRETEEAGAGGGRRGLVCDFPKV